MYFVLITLIELHLLYCFFLALTLDLICVEITVQGPAVALRLVNVPPLNYPNSNPSGCGIYSLKNIIEVLADQCV